MSTFWTPEGERPINSESEQPLTPRGPKAESQADRQPAGFAPAAEEADAEPMNEAELEALRQQLLSAPAEIVVANHAFGLFELAALHLSAQPANLTEAQLAIDALGALVENLTGRLGEAETQLLSGLASLRMAFVQIRQTADQPESN